MNKVERIEFVISEFRKADITIDENQADKFVRLCDFMVEYNENVNLTSITEFSEVVVKHFVDSVLPFTMVDIPQGSSFIDVGTGAGFPAIPLLICRPDLKGTLEIWDMQMAEYGRRIIEKRQKFVEELNGIIQEIHRNLTGQAETLEIIYEPSCTAEELELVTARNRERDMRMKMTSAGPHRDDLCVRANGIDIRRYGSQGQQRTAALSLKLSEIYIVERKIKDTPILLLDDVLSELDSSRQNYLLESIHDIQTMITCTGLDDFVSHQFHINKVFQVVQGTVCQP